MSIGGRSTCSIYSLQLGVFVLLRPTIRAYVHGHREPKRATATGTMADNINESTREPRANVRTARFIVFGKNTNVQRRLPSIHTGRCARPIAYGQIQICCVHTHTAEWRIVVAAWHPRARLVVRQRCMQRVLYI